MARLVLGAVCVAVLVSGIFAQTDEHFKRRDEWYRVKNNYTDLPRVFDLKDGCPDKKFYLDCNKCDCKEDGKTADCTEKGCRDFPQIVNWGFGKPCPTGKRFFWKCNDCWCDQTGKSAKCTRMACPNLDTGKRE